MRKLGSTTWIVGLLTALNLLSYIDRFVFAAVLPPIQRELGLNDTQGGILISAFVIVYSLASPIFGMIGDRTARIPLLLVAALLWCAATGLTGTAMTFGMLLVWRASIGIGEAAFGSIGPALIDERVGPRNKSKVLGFFYVAIFLGAALGYVLGGGIQEAVGWRKTFMWIGFGGIPVALLLLLTEDRRSAAAKPSGKSSLLESARECLRIQKTLLSYPLYLFTVLGFTVWTFVVPAFSSWAPAFIEREMGMPLAAGNYRLGIITVVTGIAGTLLGAWWGDRWAKSNPRGPLLVCALSTLPAIVGMTWAMLTHDPAQFWAATTLALLALSMCMGPGNAMILSSVPYSMRSSAMALSIFMTHWLGDVFSPTLVGWWSDSHGLRQALLYLPAVLTLCVFFWLYACRFVASEQSLGSVLSVGSAPQKS